MGAMTGGWGFCVDYLVGMTPHVWVWGDGGLGGVARDGRWGILRGHIAGAMTGGWGFFVDYLGGMTPPLRVWGDGGWGGGRGMDVGEFCGATLRAQ